MKQLSRAVSRVIECMLTSGEAEQKIKLNDDIMRGLGTSMGSPTSR